ncbi:hypothetical protein FDECE_12158 [Fusarium decemcellulare]|nr:hypothetical protein FDECE_12158 [Fusarium decemcellulare]
MELQDAVLSIEKVEDDEVEDTYIYRISRTDRIRGRRIVLYDLSSLQDVEEVKHRTWRFQESAVQCYLKMARFAFEMEALERETRAYLRLASARTNLAPKILGYAYEETPDRIIGLVIESVEGQRPSPADLEVCTNALEQLHGLGIIHGDINNHNIILCGDSVKFIDFEDSYIRLTSSDRSWGWRTSLEMKILKDRLLSQSDVGRPWN